VLRAVAGIVVRPSDTRVSDVRRELAARCLPVLVFVLVLDRVFMTPSAAIT
jgi:hypothetical protein